MAASIFSQNFPGATALQSAADTADYIIGLDLHKKTTAVCVVDRKQMDTPVFHRKRLANSELLSVLHRFAGNKVVACEAAYGWFLLRDALRGVPGVTFIPLDARKTASWIKTSGIKNDRIDAQVLCCACLHGGIGRLAIHQPERHARECTQLSRSREQLVRQRRRVRQQLQSLERDCGPNPYTGEIPGTSVLIRSLESDLCDALRILDARIAKTEEQMRHLSANDTVVSLLQSIPGIGPITAFALRHKIETIDRFESAAHLSSYFGFGVRQRQSGETLVRGKIAKSGDSLIRKLLIQGAQVIRFRRPDLPPLYFPHLAQAELMADRRHANKVVTALARKNLTFVYHIWNKQVPFDLERYRKRRQYTSSPVSSSTLSVSVCPPSKAAELVCESCAA